jgi:hypothetical protein
VAIFILWPLYQCGNGPGAHWIRMWIRTLCRKSFCSCRESKAGHSAYHHHQRQKRPFSAIAFLRRFCQIASGFRIFGFCNNNFLHKARSSALRPTPNLEKQVPVLMSPSDRVASYTPGTGSFTVVFYDSQDYGGGIITGLHTGISSLYSCASGWTRLLRRQLMTFTITSSPRSY